MKGHRGDVVLVSLPFSSGVGAKVRPALVVRHDRDNRRRMDTIVAQITSNLRRAGEPTHVLIDRATPEGQATGLLHDSMIVCGNLATIESGLIHRIIGRLPPAMMTQVDECLRDALGLESHAGGIGDEIRLRLVAQRALLTHVTPDLRGVSVDIEPERRKIRMRFTFQAQPSDSVRDTATGAATGVIADFPGDWTLEEEYINNPSPAPIEDLRLVVFRRCEGGWVGTES